MENVVVRMVPLKDASPEWNNGRRYSRQSSAPPALNLQQKSEQSLAAFLPSKFAYSTVRMRNMDDRNKFFKTVRGVMTVRGLRGDLDANIAEYLDHGSAVETEPDLDVEQIKELPISMDEKRALNSKNHQEGRSVAAIFRKYKHKRWMYRLRQKWAEASSKIQIWQRDMKKIEGNYGTGVVAYFFFIKWLTLLNLFNFVLILGFIIVPRLVSSSPNLTSDVVLPTNCTRNYTDNYNAEYISSMTSIESDFVETLQDFVQGTGIMEYTAFFYGYYQVEDIVFNSNIFGRIYNRSAAYVFTILVVLFISLFMIVREASKGITYRFHEGDERFYRYCNLVFGGWEFCIDNEKAAQMKKVLITNEFRDCLESERLLEERKNRSRAKRNMLIAIRIVVNVIQLSILGGCGFLIYFVFNESTKKLRNELASVEKFLYQFLPSITIVCLNIVVPIMFKFMVDFEKYSPNFTISILLVRTVFLRLASIIVFYASMYQKITGESGDCIRCWESFVGQQIYRLALTDFATHILLTFLINFPRSLLAEKYSNIPIVRFLCEQSFDLPKHVLDIVYTQMLCWLGSFYAPSLPGMFVIIFFLLFYIKKFACLVNSKPGAVIHRTSKSKFMIILLIALAVAVFPILYTIGEIGPSMSCGPFRNWDYISDAIDEAFESAPQVILDIIEYATTIYVGIILFIILILFIAYYVAVNNANKHMARALKTQVLLEGHDKKFLLEKLSGFINEQRQTG